MEGWGFGASEWGTGMVYSLFLYVSSAFFPRGFPPSLSFLDYYFFWYLSFLFIVKTHGILHMTASR